MTNINFDSKDLKVDYLSFNLQFNNHEQIQEIADFLADTFNCRSTLLDQSSKKRHVLAETDKNLYSAEFVVNSNKHWKGSILSFRGRHAQWFYKDLKFQKLDWSIFDFEDTNLGRVDLCYDRKLKASDKDLNLFFKNSSRRINSKKDNRSAKSDHNILRVGKRSSSNFYRVYQKTKNINRSVYIESIDGLEFELEVKKDVIKSFQQFLFNNQIEEFEKRLTQHFFNQSKQNFGLNFYYTDWVRDFYRKLSDRREFNAGLVTDYIKQTKFDSLDETMFLFRFLQFLSFIRRFEGKKECIDDQVYYIIEFPIVDFLHFLDKNVKSTYQRTKLMEFFKDLQELPPFVEKFSDSEFRSSIMFPFLKLTKQGRSWFLRIAIGEQLYWYSYPFRWTSSLCNFQNKYDLLVKLEIIQVFSTDSLKKKFSVEDFLNQFSIPNKKRAEIKKLIIDLLDELKAFDLIEAGFDIVYKDGKKPEKGVKMLTPSILSQSKEIFLHEIIDSNN